jgi:putative hydrolase of the HAD superfamily
MMAAVRNVIFDLGGVLLDWNPGAILERCYSDVASRDAVRDALFRHEDWLAFNRGDVTEPGLLARVQQRTERSLPELRQVLDAVRDSLVVKPETVTVLRALRKRRVPLYCLSDMPVSVFAHVRQRYDFWDAFMGIVISGEVRMMKPGPEVFEYLLARYELAAEETVFVDDHAPNIAGAKAVGLQTIHFRNAADCARELEACLTFDCD